MKTGHHGVFRIDKNFDNIRSYMRDFLYMVLRPGKNTIKRVRAVTTMKDAEYRVIWENLCPSNKLLLVGICLSP